MEMGMKHILKFEMFAACRVAAVVGLAVFCFLSSIFWSNEASAERIKDLASIQGVRDNQLIGYGLVVGLDGTGDQTTQTPFTVQSTISMLTSMGVTLPPGTSLQLKNVAAVTITATLPPFARPGQTIDVTVSSIGNAQSLTGGTLVMTPLKGADGQVYAMAQGNLLVGSVGGAIGGAKPPPNHLSVGRIPAGATVERAVQTLLGQGDYINLELNTTDFTTATHLVQTINRELSPDKEIATALDGRLIKVRAPEGNARVAFISQVENLQIDPAHGGARVIINARTGSVVMNQTVALDNCAISHGNLTVVVNSDAPAGQANALAGGEIAQASKAAADKGNVVILKKGVTLSDVVKALNSIGATPQDLLAILQAMKSAGALRAELEII
jgi:flagellar P-ring protein precursor FlgI